MIDPLRRSLLFALALVTFAVVCARFVGSDSERTSALVAIEDGRLSALGFGSTGPLLHAATLEARVSVRLYEEALRTRDPAKSARAASRAVVAARQFKRCLDATSPADPRPRLRQLTEDALANAASLSNPINVEPRSPEAFDEARRLQRRVVRLESILDELEFELLLAQKRA